MTRKRPEAPDHLQEPTRMWWEAVAGDWVLEEHHLRLLTLAGEAWDRTVQAREALAESGITYTDRFNTPKARPEIAIERDSRLAFSRLLRELCLDEITPDEKRPPRAGGRK